MPRVTVQPPLDPPGSSAVFLQRPPVRIRHPGYGQSDFLFQLESVDVAVTAGDVIYGVQYAVVHTACAIIADNRFDGWLSTSSDSSNLPGRVLCDDGDVLPGAEYYFHVPINVVSIDVASDSGGTSTLSPHPYHIVPTFRLWQFPHNQLPRAWQDAGAAIQPADNGRDARGRDQACRLTGCALMTSIAHIVPQAEKGWFNGNEMNSRYCTATTPGQDLIGGPENTLLLRQDLHLAWDQMKFGLLPKQHIDDSWRWVAHARVTQPEEIHTLYHNRQLHTITGVRYELLFARFAWDIFPGLRSFLSTGTPRWLKGHGGVVRSFSGPESEEFCFNQGSLRSISPPKRDRSKRSREEETGSMEDRSRVMTSIDSAIGGSADDDDFQDFDVNAWLREQQKFEESLKADNCGWMKNCRATEEERTRGRKRRRTASLGLHHNDHLRGDV